jgi:SAM-dependent methyltransferase
MRPWTRKALCGLNRTVGRWLPPGIFTREVPGIPGRVHVDDQMYRSDAPQHVRHYVEDARSAMENIEESLAAAGRSWADIEACLDFACGYGRVTRWLASVLGPSRVTAADVDRQAIRFCARELGVRPLAAHAESSRTVFPEPYDLIFIGSLLTHLPLAACTATLSALAGVLRPRGLLVFSTQGESCLAHLEWYGSEFLAAAEELRSGVQSQGGGFVPYRGRRHYGIAILARRYVEAMMQAQLGDGLRLVRFVERGWDRHQDVWCYQRVGADCPTPSRRVSCAASTPPSAPGAAPLRGDRP